MLRRLVFAAFVAALALPAQAQLANAAQRHPNGVAGLDVPAQSVATVEEAASPTINPAGIGFLDALELQYFHEGGSGRDDRAFEGDGVYLATPLGGLAGGLSMEWLRPALGNGQRYRKTGWSLALADSQAFSLGVSWNLFSSPDGALEKLQTFDLGLTVRPWRYLSLAASVLDMGARLGDRVLPVRYDFGLATRLWRDRVTLAADLYADDDARGAFVTNYVAATANLEVLSGLLLNAQYVFPLSPIDSQYYAGGFVHTPGFFLGLTLNTAHFGWSGGAAHATGKYGPVNDGWVTGIRLSGERYRSGHFGVHKVPVIDVAGILERPTALIRIGEKKDPMRELLEKLEDARDDRSVAAVVLKLDSLPLGKGNVELVRDALAAIRARGKKVVAYVVEAGMNEYYLATACDAIYTAPSGALMVNGAASVTPFFKDGLAKLGVTVESVHAGLYKNAPDQFTRSDMSEYQREVTNLLLDDTFNREVKAIAGARHLTEAEVRALVDQGMFNAPAAQQAKLVDAVLWPDEVEGAVEKLVGHEVHLTGHYDLAPARGAQRWGGKPAIAVIKVAGTIAGGKSKDSPLTGATAGAETVTKQIHAAANDDDVKAIVVWVDSPGGDGLASDLIWRELMLAKQKSHKPVIAAMGDYAASGGYFIAVAADAIVAEPSTLTGSIGVFAIKPEFSGTWKKLGVNPVVLTRGKNAELLTINRPWTPDERALMQKQIDFFYDTFLGRVAEGRHLSKAEVEKLAGGHVWTGQQALDRKLVDRLGSLQDAIALAKEKAGIGADEPVELRYPEREGGLMEDLAGPALRASADGELTSLAVKALPELRAAALLSQLGPVVALPPEWLLGSALAR